MDTNTDATPQRRVLDIQYAAPETVEEAEDRLVALISEAQEIQWQIQFTDLEHWKGTQEEYTDWRKRATFAMNAKRQEARWVRTWIVRSTSPAGIYQRMDDVTKNTNQLLREVYEHFSRGNLSPSSQQLLSRIRKHLKRCGAI